MFTKRFPAPAYPTVRSPGHRAPQSRQYQEQGSKLFADDGTSGLRLPARSPEQLLLDGRQTAFDHIAKSWDERTAGAVRVDTPPIHDKAERDRRRLDDHLPGIGQGVEVSHGREVFQQI